MKYWFGSLSLALLVATPFHQSSAGDFTTVTSTKSPVSVDANRLLQDARSAKNLPNVAENGLLTKAAQAHTEYMASVKKLTHEGRNGSNVSDRIKAQGYKGCVFIENIAQTSGDVNAAFSIWMNSKPHKANIQNSKAKEYGISHASGYWTLVLSGAC